MTDVLSAFVLEKWEAIELVYRLIYRYEKTTSVLEKEKVIQDAVAKLKKANKSFSDFKIKKASNIEDFFLKNDADSVIKEYRSAYRSDPISIKAFKSFGYVKAGLDVREVGALQNLCSLIYHGKPITIPLETFNAFLNYIKGEEWGEKIGSKQIVFSQDENEKGLINTEWWLYRSGDQGGKTGITRSLLKIRPFNKVELYSFYAEKHLKEDYLGYFRVSTINPGFFILDLKPKIGRKNSFRIVMYVSQSTPEFSIGDIQAIGEGFIYSAPCLLVRKNDDNAHYEYADFFTANMEHAEIDSVIWNYFDPIFQHMHVLKADYSNLKSFEDDWLKDSKKRIEDLRSALDRF